MRVFISHSHADYPQMQRLASQLEQLDYQTYLYEHDSQPGIPIAGKVQKELNACNLVIVLLSKSSYNSPYVHQEIGFAVHAGKSIIPLIEKGVSASDLAMLQGVEYVEVDPEHPDETLIRVAAHAHRLGREQQQREDTTLAIIGILVLIVGVYVLTQTGRLNLKIGS